MNERANLEDQLASVVERIDVTIIQQEKENPSSEVLDLRQTTSETVTIEADPVRSFDKSLIQNLGPRPSKRLTVTIGEHVPSEHVLPVEIPAEPVMVEAREPIMAGIHQWTAPYEAPVSMDDLAAAASDLKPDVVDPHWYAHQYTPGEANTAFQERYRWWNRLRSPFVVWEHAYVQPVVEKVEDEVEELREEGEQIVTGAEQNWGAPVLVPRLSPIRVLAGFFGLALIVSLPAGAVSLGHSLSSSWSSVEGSGRAALSEAKSMQWSDAAASLSASDAALNHVNVLAVAISKALPQTRDAYTSARSLVSAGEKAAQAAALLSKGADKAFAAEAHDPVERIRLFGAYVENAAPLLDDAASSLADVNTDALPSDLRAKADEAKDTLTQVQTGLRETRVLSDLAAAALGETSDRRYLFIFQNPAELRPTGGFMGSYAEVLFNRGKISKLDVPGGGPYDLQSQLKARVRPPAPMRLISSRWEFQDANWFPDFQASAKKINWFWSQAGQPTLDGIVALNARLVVNLLKITGPIEMPEYGKTITADNFMNEAQLSVEVEYDKEENKPKKFIGDLMKALMERLSHASHDQWIAIAKLASDSLTDKDIQMWFSRSDEQDLATRYGWAGQWKPALGDTLAVINTNIAGQKSDYLIEEHVDHQAVIAEDGSITDTVTITRTHHGQKGEQFHGANNVTYLRVYVPQGSELLSASGFQTPDAKLFDTPLVTDPDDADLIAAETHPRIGPSNVRINDELGRTSFGGWIQLEPGTTAKTTFTYRLPFTVSELSARLQNGVGRTSAAPRPAYVLEMISQSGKPERTIDATVQYPPAWTPAWSNSGDTLGYNGLWDRDRVVAGLFQAP